MATGDDSMLARQLALTEAYWAELARQGVQAGSVSPVDAFFFTSERRIAEALAADLGAEDGWRAFLARTDEKPVRWIVKIVTRPVVLGREVFLELAKIMVSAALTHGCEFDGFELAIPDSSGLPH